MNTFCHVPPGFRFHPTDEELVDYYLRKKVASKKIDLDVIKDVDLYKIEPWDLQEKCKIGMEEQNEWHFFSHKDKKYPTGTRTNRATTAGFWKATGRDKPIYTKNYLVGMRKTLVFYKGRRAPNGQKSDWIMHEYRLETNENEATPAPEEGWVVCRVFKKRVATVRRMADTSPCWFDDHAVGAFMPDLESSRQLAHHHHHHHHRSPVLHPHDPQAAQARRRLGFRVPPMESLPRKRKGARSACSLAGSLHESPAARKRTCREPKPRPEKKKPSSGGGDDASARGGVVMTAPPASGRGAPESPGRGLKRKLGCIESATRIGRKKRLESEYELGGEIGEGKFGSVRICRAKAGGEEFACKALPKNGEETVHREVEIMQHLSGHPGVVTLKAVFEDADKFYLVMELCSGGRLLDEMAREGRFSEQRAAIVIKDLMAVVKYCHEMGVVHRDIKPENILLTKAGKMKLADFGLAARVTNGQKLSGVAGSPAYVAPEVLSGSYYDKVDIWGAGVLLHVLLLGSLPFQGGCLEAVFESIKTVELDFHSGPWESISVLGRDLISRMLNRDVSSRITADEILSHPWVLFYTECPLKAVTGDLCVTNKIVAPRIPWDRIRSHCESLSSDSSSQRSDDQDECGIVDALTAAITRVKISEPKRSRLCNPAIPIQQECSSNLKSNLCTAF